MKARIGVVATGYGHRWSDHDVVLRRLCGALACHADVDVLLPGGPGGSGQLDGAVRLVRFPGEAPSPSRRLALRRALLGPQPADAGVACECTEELQRHLAGGLPAAAQEAFLRAVGGWSPELFRHVADSPYDVVVFAGCQAASTYWGMEALGRRRPTVVLTLAVDDALLASPHVAEVLSGCDRVLATTTWEADLLRRRCGGRPRDEVVTGFVLHVNDMARRAPAFGFDGRATLVVARDWGLDAPSHELLAWCARLAERFGSHLGVRLVGPGTQRLPRALRAEFAGSRSDVWRWMAHAIAVLDPRPQRLVACEVLEAMCFGRPVIVDAGGGASRHHAEVANGGLWYRSYRELEACVGAVMDAGVRDALGRQAKAYVSDAYGDTRRYVDTVCDGVLALA